MCEDGSIPAGMLTTLWLCCGDGPSGEFARQIHGNSEFVVVFLRGVMCLRVEAMPRVCEGGLLGLLCGSAVKYVPRLRELLWSSGFSEWAYRVGAVSQPDVCGPIIGGGKQCTNVCLN